MTLKGFQHKGPFVITLHIFLSIKKKKKEICDLFCSQEHISFLHPHRASEPNVMSSF